MPGNKCVTAGLEFLEGVVCEFAVAHDTLDLCEEALNGLGGQYLEHVSGQLLQSIDEAIDTSPATMRERPLAAA